jgi:TP53 regulating kinase-like protein
MITHAKGTVQGGPYAEFKLMKKGAEANLFLGLWYGIPVVMKKRVPKAYRNPDLDLMIRTSRTIHEARLLHEAKIAGVATPTVFLVDIPNTTIVMEYVGGDLVKTILDRMVKKEREELLVQVGRSVGKLHKFGIIHGDLTTSNMIMTPEGRVLFIDFGLGELKGDVEKMGTDLHLLERALESTHYKIAKRCFKCMMRGYVEEVGEDKAKDVLKRIQEIRARARYVERTMRLSGKLP